MGAVHTIDRIVRVPYLALNRSFSAGSANYSAQHFLAIQ